jgi:hypothetical protein
MAIVGTRALQREDRGVARPALVIGTCRHWWTVSNEQGDSQGELKAAAREVDFWQISDSRDRIAKLIVVTDEATPEPTAIGI